MIQWLIDWIYGNDPYKNVITEMEDKFTRNGVKPRAEREPVMSELRRYFILNGTKRDAEK